MTKKHKIILSLCLVLATVVLFVRFGLPYLANRRAEQFVDHWAALFAEHQDLQELQELKRTDAADRPDLIYIRKFDSGQWIAARNAYSCMNGGSFDATVFLDSDGRIHYQIGRNFCGYEGLCGELNMIPATSLPQFYAGLKNKDMETTTWTPQNTPL